MFVIFHDFQAVPEYLVTFKKKWCDRCVASNFVIEMETP
jgi:hypothetical protein